MTKKKKIAAIVSVLTVATLAVGATLAYLNDTTETVTNTFASNKNISISLREPGWDGYDFNTPDSEYQWGEDVSEANKNNMDLGFNQAKSYVPGQVIPKNPTVKNTGTAENDSVDAYIALKVQYFDNENKQVSYEAFKKAYLEETGIAFSSDWTLAETMADNSQVYVYSDTLPKALTVGTESTPLFTEVPLSLDLEPNDEGVFPQFQIKVTAYAIQKNEIAPAKATEKLLEFVKAN